ncbi:methyltransferase domain-containing protein [Kitasatospora sp. NPDC049285]|uniref:class I SAM-dependent methyltransferase n=1 Tax=Kitasatospora sp. NPDC049285 TaxID=3157096 RepID=UPI00343BE8CF
MHPSHPTSGIPTTPPVPGTAGYAEAADTLAVQYEEVTFEQVHARVLHLLPAAPARILDLGAGTGRDAAALAARGHQVLAVEPTAELRAHGRRLHPDPAITWLDAALPDLTLPHHAALEATFDATSDAAFDATFDATSDAAFDAVFATAVWMHLAPAERERSMARIAALLAPAGRLFLTLRHGPVPPGRVMYDVSAAETTTLAARHHLHPVHHSERQDLHSRNGVTWSELAFRADPVQP